jgi:predicted RNase H-like HicB family nuclease
MRYQVTVKQLIDGDWYARCVAAPSGVAVAQAKSKEEALENLRAEIRYQLEWCPCSGVADDYVQLDEQ